MAENLNIDTYFLTLAIKEHTGENIKWIDRENIELNGQRLKITGGLIHVPYRKLKFRVRIMKNLFKFLNEERLTNISEQQISHTLNRYGRLINNV